MADAVLDDIIELHWTLDMLQSIDVGVVVLDKEYRIQVWNGFMESHSNLIPEDVRDKSLFEFYPEINKQWLVRKTRPVFELKTRAFMTWEQRPYLFKFPNYRPLTGTEEFMYQNITLFPLISATGSVDHICMLIYDVTDVAAAQKQFEALQVEMSEHIEGSNRLKSLDEI